MIRARFEVEICRSWQFRCGHLRLRYHLSDLFFPLTMTKAVDQFLYIVNSHFHNSAKITKIHHPLYSIQHAHHGNHHTCMSSHNPDCHNYSNRYHSSTHTQCANPRHRQSLSVELMFTSDTSRFVSLCLCVPNSQRNKKNHRFNSKNSYINIITILKMSVCTLVYKVLLLMKTLYRIGLSMVKINY